MKLKQFKILAIYFCFTPIVSASGSTPAASEPLIAMDRIEESTIFFKSTEAKKTATPKPLKTSIFDLNYLGSLVPASGIPYFLFSGKPCQTCQEDKAIYAVRPTGEKPNAFVYPGKILDPKNRALLMESRAFFGKCLPRKGDVYVVFQRERVDRRPHPQASVFIAEAGDTSLQEILIERNLPRLQTTLEMVRKKSCKEIAGRNRMMASRPMSLTPGSRTGDSEADDRDDTEGLDP